MYIDEVKTKTSTGKISHICILLRESYRKAGKSCKRTIANLTHCNAKEIAAIKFALENKDKIEALNISTGANKNIQLQQGISVGAVWVLYDIARRIGIEKALGVNKEGKLALWLVLARIINQGSVLSAVRLAKNCAACDVMGIRDDFNEDHIYPVLAWLSENQQKIEDTLYKTRRKGKKTELFLYDVTSSYFEGENNELADWGYNRDKKSGKLQIVLGMLCDEDGDPISIEVFEGNTTDPRTLSSQIQKVAERFGCEHVIFVGDRGMIKSSQIEELNSKKFNYITAITKPQVEKLIREDIFQLELFTTDVCEIEMDQIRYILRRNPCRAQEILKTRQQKREYIEKFIAAQNKYLVNHSKAEEDVALKKVKNKIKGLRLWKWLDAEIKDRTISLKENAEALKAMSELDGCYVLKTDLAQDFDKQIIHDRYKDLSKVESVFRTCKTMMLEIRPWHVRTEESTRGKALIIMLAYLVARHLEKHWKYFDLTVEEGIDILSQISTMHLTIAGQDCHQIPIPNKISADLLKSLDVILPEVLPSLGTIVDTRKKLFDQRKSL